MTQKMIIRILVWTAFGISVAVVVPISMRGPSTSPDATRQQQHSCAASHGSGTAPYITNPVTRSRAANSTLMKVSQDSPSGIIDGSQHPELIPDEYAYHILFLTASVDDSPKPTAQKRATAVIRSLSLTSADAAVVTDVAARYRAAFRRSDST